MKWGVEIFGRIVEFPRSFTNIFQLISSPSPVCSYIAPTKKVSELLLKMLEPNIKANSSIMKALQIDLPFFHNLMADLGIETCLPKEWKGLLLNLEACANKPFSTAQEVRVSPSNLEDSKYSW